MSRCREKIFRIFRVRKEKAGANAPAYCSRLSRICGLFHQKGGFGGVSGDQVLNRHLPVARLIVPGNRQRQLQCAVFQCIVPGKRPRFTSGSDLYRPGKRPSGCVAERPLRDPAHRNGQRFFRNASRRTSLRSLPAEGTSLPGSPSCSTLQASHSQKAL